MKNTNTIQLEAVISDNYLVNQLKEFYHYYLEQVISDNPAICKEAGLSVKLPKKSKKADYVRIFAYFFAHKELFEALMALLPAHVVAMIEEAVWGECLDDQYVLEHYQEVITQDVGYVYNAYQELKPPYLFFQNSPMYLGWSRYRDGNTYYHYLYLESELAAHLRTFLPSPASSQLPKISNIEDAPIRFDASESIFQELPIVNAYIDQGRLKLNKKGKITEASLKKMAKFCSLKEFFESAENKVYATLRTRFLSNLALYMNEYTKPDVRGDVVLALKEIIAQFAEEILAPEDILFHTKGWDYVYSSSDPYNDFLAVLDKIPTEEWVAIDALQKLIQHYDVDFRLVVNAWDLNSISTLLNKTHPYNYKLTMHLGDINHRALITTPFLRNNLALFAALGMLELAYDKPAYQDKLQTHERYLTPSVEFKYVRLTKLGAYILEKTNDFTPPKLKEDKVILDENHLLLLYQGENKGLVGMIENVSEKVAKNLYQVSFETVLGNCNNAEQVAGQIRVFQQLLSKNPPQIWQTFFEALQQKSYQLANQNETYLIYQLPDNRELLKLIATDEFLRQHIIRAEYHNILIPQKHKAKIKKYLKKSGFLIEFN